MRQSRILIVEDESIVAADLADRLTGMGHTVVGIAATGPKAMELAVAHRPELVLMDIRLKGGIDGVELAGLLATSIEVPVIYLSAYADEATLQRAGATQPYGYLLKPVNERELRATIETTLVRFESEMKRLRSNRSQSATLSSLAQAIVAVDTHGDVLFVNAAAADLLGCAMDAAVGRTAVGLLGLAAGATLPDVGTVAEVAVQAADGVSKRVRLRADAGAQVFATDPEVVLTLTPVRD